jgi:hypothetical protein
MLYGVLGTRSSGTSATGQVTLSNPNLLDNWYFIGGGTFTNFPVNQRGQTSYAVSGQMFTADRWLKNSAVYVYLQSDCMALARSAAGNDNFSQYLDNPAALAGRQCVFSLLVKGDTGTKINLGYNDGGGNTYSEQFTLSSSAELLTFTFTVSAAPTQMRMIFRGSWPDTTSKIYLYAAKLELGNEQTLAHLENGAWVINEIPNYWDELYKCLRYVKKINAWYNIYPARTDADNLYFFISGVMANAPSTLTSLQVYFYSGNNYYTLTADCSFNHYYDGVRGKMAKSTIPDNIGGSLVLASTVFLSAES